MMLHSERAGVEYKRANQFIPARKKSPGVESGGFCVCDWIEMV